MTVPIDQTLFDNTKKFIDEQIRPLIQGDGGDIEVVDLTDTGVLKVRLQGSCVNCASSAMTLAFGVEARIKEEFPKINSVQQVN